jgi:hypothetical protein
MIDHSAETHELRLKAFPNLDPRPIPYMLEILPGLDKLKRFSTVGH